MSASLASIINHVDKIIIVSSNTGWDGQPGNTVLQVADLFKTEHDSDNKITILQSSTSEQSAQYRLAVEYAARYNPDWWMLIDSDEVWTETACAKAKRYLCFDYYALCLKMTTFVRTARIKVLDKADTQVHPVVFVRGHIHDIGLRGSGILSKMEIAGACVNHYALVRDTPDEIYGKIKRSHIADKHGQPTVDIDKWMRDVYHGAPGKAYHYYRGCENIWDETVEIPLDDVPPVVKRFAGAYL